MVKFVGDEIFANYPILEYLKDRKEMRRGDQRRKVLNI